jgi:hypothetical protein
MNSDLRERLIRRLLSVVEEERRRYPRVDPWEFLMPFVPIVRFAVCLDDEPEKLVLRFCVQTLIAVRGEGVNPAQALDAVVDAAATLLDEVVDKDLPQELRDGLRRDAALRIAGQQ